MEWYLNRTSLCYVDETGNITHRIHTLSDFHCEYKHGQLSLIFKKMKPLESANSVYKCKLQSNKGADYIHTKVELQGQSTFIYLFLFLFIFFFFYSGHAAFMYLQNSIFFNYSDFSCCKGLLKNLLRGLSLTVLDNVLPYSYPKVYRWHTKLFIVVIRQSKPLCSSGSKTYDHNNNKSPNFNNHTVLI